MQTEYDLDRWYNESLLGIYVGFQLAIADPRYSESDLQQYIKGTLVLTSIRNIFRDARELKNTNLILETQQ